MSDLRTRRARVQGMDSGGTVITIAPWCRRRIAELQHADLRSLTGTGGAFSVKPHGYQDVPDHLAKRTIEERRAEMAAG